MIQSKTQTSQFITNKNPTYLKSIPISPQKNNHTNY